jgi:predicted AlkP superfamily pyrophosphatase or phosphodiesterase
VLEVAKRGAGMAAVLLIACATPVATEIPLLPDPAPRAAPRLVVQITVDQLRGDLPLRFRERFGAGGFRRLLDGGTWYADAHYGHSDTETAVGHATLVTGAHPAQHGLVSNLWFDRALGRMVYAVEDARYQVVGEPPRNRTHAGTSPRNLSSSTLGDELVYATGGRSRVFSVSGKDRGAIIPGGHTGRAFWYSRATGGFVTSSYYYDALPAWAQAWNDARPADRYRNQSWELSRPAAEYDNAARDAAPFEPQGEALGATFPHAYGDGSSPFFHALLGVTPAGDELTLDFAKALIEAEGLGQGPATDYLAVSFSATDYVGHLFGPGSLEAEDNLLRLDRVLADLFDFLDARLGLANVLLVLSADHGSPDPPERMAELGMEAGRVDIDAIEKGALQQAVRERLGVRENLIALYDHPWIYLDGPALGRAKLDPELVQRAVADEAVKIPGIHLAVTRSDLLGGNLPHGELYERIQNNLHPTRSGDVYLVQQPYWFLFNVPEDFVFPMAAIHGSPWSYDTHVPVVFAGPGVPSRMIWRRVGPEDVAPTLAAYLGILAPSGSAGVPLVEVLPAP